MTIVAGTSTDQYGALMDAICAARNAGGGVVRLPAGDIILGSTVTAQDMQYVNIKGDSTDATRIWMEGAGLPWAFDLLGPGPGTGVIYPNDRRYCGVSGLTILGDHLPSDSECGGVRLGQNHRSVDLLNRVNIKNMPGDGILHDGDNWNTKLSNIQVHSSAFRKAGAAGWRMTDNVKSLNFLSAEYITIEACGNPNLFTLVGGKKRYSAISSGINLCGASNSTNRGWHLNMIEAENNYGIVEMMFGRMLDFIMTAPYIEALPGVSVGIEMSDSNGTITVPCLNAEVGGSTAVTPDKAMKFYGNSNVVIQSYRRGGGWLTNDLETHDAAKVFVTGGANLRTAKSETSVITTF